MDKILYLPHKLKDLSASLMANYLPGGRYRGGNEQGPVGFRSDKRLFGKECLIL
jgi:hypothetical protein